MLSPALAVSIGGVKTPEDLLKLPIVDPSDPWWKLWFGAAGIPEPDLRGDPRSRFGDQHLEGKAVIAGQGVGILTPAFYETELAQGQLIQPFDIVGTAERILLARLSGGAAQRAEDPRLPRLAAWSTGDERSEATASL